MNTTDTESQNSRIIPKSHYIDANGTGKYKKSHRGKCALCNGSKIVKAYTCEFCEYATVRSRDLIRHVNIIHRFKTTASYTKCDFCDFKSSKAKLERHVQSKHLKEKVYKCQLCSFFTHEQNRLTLHFAEAHMNFEGFKCKICGYKTKIPSHLKYHIVKEHSESKRFICDICCYNSAKKSTLKVHIESVHLGTKNYHCTFCDFSTSQNCYLQNHLNDVHLNLNSVKCPICGTVLSRKNHLKFHIESIHLKSVDKENKCDKCDYSTWKKSNLKRHAKIHLTVEQCS